MTAIVTHAAWLSRLAGDAALAAQLRLATADISPVVALWKCEKITAWNFSCNGITVEPRLMTSPHKPTRTGSRADRILVRAIFMMLALLLHIEALRLFNPQYKETSAGAKAPLVVQLKPAPQPAPGLPVQSAVSRPPGTEQPETPQRPPSAALPQRAEAAPQAMPEPEPEPFYHSPHALTRPPELVEDAPEEIELGELQEAGHLLLRLAIDRYGVVDGVFVLRSTLARELEGQVVLQFYQASYRPGEIDGVPVNSEMLLVVNLQ